MAGDRQEGVRIGEELIGFVSQKRCFRPRLKAETEAPGRECALCRAPPVSRNFAESSSFDTFQRGGIQNRRGEMVLPFVLYMAKLIEGPKERTF